MVFRMEEAYYGPEISFTDWEAAEGASKGGGGHLHLPGMEEACKVKRRDYIYGGGGDVELVLRFNFDACNDAGRFEAHFNADRSGKAVTGFRFETGPGGTRAWLREEMIADAGPPDVSADAIHEIRLATLGMEFELHFDSHCLAAGRMPENGTDNEGIALLGARQAHVRVLSFEENFIVHPQEPPAWERQELLYEESFTPESLKANWIVNTGKPGSGPELTEGGCVFHRMCNAFLRQRFEGPLAVEYLATPMPTDEFCAGVTDAIFIWMLDKPDGSLVEYLDACTAEGKAGLNNLLPVPLYWVDFGGSNNVTTRLRRNPGRRLMRQFVDRPRLLERGRTYRITAAQIDDFLEFHVDGSPMIACRDPEPLTAGHVGVRAFCADLRLDEFKVWRIG